MSFDVSKLTDQELVDLKKRMENAGERLGLVRDTLSSAIISVGTAIQSVERVAKLLPLDDVEGGQSNEAWRIARELHEVFGAMQNLRYRS